MLSPSKIGAKEMVRLIEEYDIHPVIAKTWGFRDAPEAFKMLVGQKEIGKIVIKIDP
jgi:NADPH:quinone reductase-like Zn-dependent oxidoreductase